MELLASYPAASAPGKGPLIPFEKEDKWGPKVCGHSGKERNLCHSRN